MAFFMTISIVTHLAYYTYLTLQSTKNVLAAMGQSKPVLNDLFSENQGN